MTSIPLHYESLTDLAGKIESKAISPVEVTETLLGRIEALDPRLKSYTTVTVDLALQQAHQAEQEIMAGRYRGTMHGIPVAVKDLCFTKGITTTGGMTLYRDFKPDHDATVVRKLADAGSVLLGKLHMTEGAGFEHHRDFPQPVNPWNADAWTGVSSSGSGVATAAGFAYATIGSDTGGSIRFPTAANGLTGVKPTWGLISRYGIFDLAGTFDHLGPMARSAADAAAMLQALAGNDPLDPTSLNWPVPDYLQALAGIYGAQAVRIGLDWNYVGDDTEPATFSSVQTAVSQLIDIGAVEVPIAFPSVGDLIPHAMQLMMAETLHHHRETYPSQAESYDKLGASMKDGLGTSVADVGRASVARGAFRGAIAKIFDEVDVVVVPVFRKGTPTWSGIRALLEANDIFSVSSFTLPFNVSGNPTVTLPCGFTDDNKPIAYQLVGKHGAEALLLRVAHAFQQATDWHLRRPIA